jgi:hypothetical protein
LLCQQRESLDSLTLELEKVKLKAGNLGYIIHLILLPTVRLLPLDDKLNDVFMKSRHFATVKMTPFKCTPIGEVRPFIWMNLSL